MGRLKGITVLLHEKTLAGHDGFGDPLYVENPVAVENVLVAPSSDTEVLTATNLYGKKAIYTLGIPKDDTHDWTDVRVSFFGQTFKTFGSGQEGIGDLIPLQWNKKVMVMRYE